MFHNVSWYDIKERVMHMNRRKLPIGIQSFEKIRTNDYVYVDKTEYLYNLVQNGDSYFLSRPRRFGKSLFVSTLKAYFEGKKELFKGLYIDQYEHDWYHYPVLFFSLSGGEYNTSNGLAIALHYVLERAITQYHLTSIPTENQNLSSRFRSVIEGLYQKTGQKVVILVDEYDKPLIDTMYVNGEQEELNRRLFKDFFSTIKDMDDYIQFSFFTGVTKFSKVSIFSDLNSLKDMSFLKDVDGICGITQQELIDYFMIEVNDMANHLGESVDKCLSSLAHMYNGYHFCANGIGVYNPFSLLNALKDQELYEYWFETGTPTFLVKRLIGSKVELETLNEGIQIQMNRIAHYNPHSSDPIPLFFFSGYLTIKDYDPITRIYTLKYPNTEVKNGLLNSLIPYVLNDQNYDSNTQIALMSKCIMQGNINKFLEDLQSLFAGIPYPEGVKLNYEKEWQTQMYLIFSLLGQNVKCEVHSALGRADCIVETKSYVYIFEFKLDRSSEEALKQIIERKYALPYQSDQRHVYQIGVSFSSHERNITSWQIQ